jgi:mannitol 2-dehydrogenase
MTRLSADALEEVSRSVAVPTYDRASVGIGIVHFGVGGFHRAHQAMYVDRLMEDGLGSGWGICGVGVMPGDRAMGAVLAAQDGLYTLVVKHPDGRLEPRVIGSIVDFVYAPDDPERVIDLMSSEQTRIVSLTITEGGYNFNQVTHEFDPDDPAVAADRQPGAVPTTVFGFVAEALDRRRRNGIAPFTVMSCDNIQSNGDMARRTFTAFAALKDPELGAWVEAEVHFPNSMVDRITPATTDQDRAELTERFGVEDGWPVVCEPFTQWVLEDSFSLGRPEFEKADVQLVSAVEPYELMKLRLLNASHQALGYLGYLCGYEYVHEAAVDPRFVTFVRNYMDREATPTLMPVPGVDLDAYKTELLERFSNPEVRDTLKRLCDESSDRIPKWVLPVIRHNLEHGGPISHATGVVASWARYAEGVDEQGRPIAIVDRLADQVTAMANRYGEDPAALLSLRQLFGDLGDNVEFRETYLDILARLHESGAAATLRALNEGTFDPA